MTDQPIKANKRQETDSEIGYKRPPAASRFRKGQSGNPRGRPKGQRNLAPVLREVLGQTVTVKRGGKVGRMSKAEAVVQLLLSQAHGGDARASKAMLELTEKISRIHTPEPAAPGVGGYEFMLVPGVAASTDEWVRSLRMGDAMAEIREIVAAGRAAGKSLNKHQKAFLRAAADAAFAAGRTITPGLLDMLREWLGLAPVSARPKVTRPVNRISKVAPTQNKQDQPSVSEPTAPV